MAQEDLYSSNMDQLVVFKLGSEEYALSILQVQEIKKMTDITRVPNTPSYITGVINLRGSVLPVIDLKNRLGLPAAEYDDDTRIIIVKTDDIVVGLIVDFVTEVMMIDKTQIDAAQTVVTGETGKYVSGIGKYNGRLIILLNLTAIVGVNI